MTGSSPSELQIDDSLEDRLSQLPDEIIADILSLLTFKEAVGSSVLSVRWRDLWRLTTNLDFDAPKLLSKLEGLKRKSTMDQIPFVRSTYVMWVNHVMRLHERSTIDEFKVKFDLDASVSDDIDEWIKFMIRKRAKRIEIDLSWAYSSNHYSFSQECCHQFKSPSNLSNIMCFRSLLLYRVDVDGELLEYLLSNCPSLEVVSIKLSRSRQLRSLKIVGPSLPLKYLKIWSCPSLESIELCAPKLQTFKYYGKEVKLSIGSNPCLSELEIGGPPHEKMTYAFVAFASHFSQLESLTVKMYLENDMDIPQAGEFGNLKHLVLKIWVNIDRSLISFIRFIQAAPSLTKFTLELSVYWRCKFRTRLPLVQPHRCLKEVELLGYYAGCGDFELAKYLVKIAPNLETMVIDPRHPEMIRLPEEYEKLAPKIQEHADELKKMLHPGAELLVS